MKNLYVIPSLLVIIAFVWLSFSTLMPKYTAGKTIEPTHFSVDRALIHVKSISQKPHYLGSEAHEEVKEYLIKQLEMFGLQVQVQEGYVLNYGISTLDRPQNIVARIKGSDPNGKSLVILSHYDSALVPSYGASDAGSGVATILESVRAFLASGMDPKNDIIIVFSDGEEIGLDGAKLFVNEHPLAKNAALVLNFEARGSGGPSNMILETNQGNANLVKAFSAANPKFPVASSLMYSIYKMLPNDTDSTIFREDGDIDSFFFAFIDDHFDYHTSLDNYENLDRESLKHQGSYLLPLLTYFSNADLSNLKAETDSVYVNFPFIKMLYYPFSWIMPMVLIAILIFIGLVFYGISKKRLHPAIIARGFLPLLISLVLCGLLGYFGWQAILWLYPQYAEIQQGFTYNGQLYIAFFVFFSLAILFKTYRNFCRKEEIASLFIAPLTFWILINVAVAIYLKGAAFFIIPVFFGLISLFILIKFPHPSLILLALLSLPAIYIFAPQIQFFPVGLGLKMLVISCVFTVLLFGLLLPIFGFYRIKNILAALCFMAAIVFFVIAHFQSDFSESRPKPNSLLYYKNYNDGSGYWVTYDKQLDDWTKNYLGDTPEDASKYIENTSGSKYGIGYSFAKKTEPKIIPDFDIKITEDSILNLLRKVSFTIVPKRKVNQINLYADKDINFETLIFNGKEVPKDTTNNHFRNRKTNFLLRFYVTKSDSLRVTYSAPKDEDVIFTVQENSYDLMKNQAFNISKRPKNTMPKPFVVTDAVVVNRWFSINTLSEEKVQKSDTLPLKMGYNYPENPNKHE